MEPETTSHASSVRTQATDKKKSGSLVTRYRARAARTAEAESEDTLRLEQASTFSLVHALQAIDDHPMARPPEVPPSKWPVRVMRGVASLLALRADRNGLVWRSISQMAAKFDCGRALMHYAFQGLIVCGIIRVVERRHGKSTRYRMLAGQRFRIAEDVSLTKSNVGANADDLAEQVAQMREQIAQLQTVVAKTIAFQKPLLKAAERPAAASSVPSARPNATAPPAPPQSVQHRAQPSENVGRQGGAPPLGVGETALSASIIAGLAADLGGGELEPMEESREQYFTDMAITLTRGHFERARTKRHPGVVTQEDEATRADWLKWVELIWSIRESSGWFYVRASEAAVAAYVSLQGFDGALAEAHHPPGVLWFGRWRSRIQVDACSALERLKATQIVAATSSTETTQQKLSATELKQRSDEFVASLRRKIA